MKLTEQFQKILQAASRDELQEAVAERGFVVLDRAPVREAVGKLRDKLGSVSESIGNVLESFEDDMAAQLNAVAYRLSGVDLEADARESVNKALAEVGAEYGVDNLSLPESDDEAVEEEEADDESNDGDDAETDDEADESDDEDDGESADEEVTETDKLRASLELTENLLDSTMPKASKANIKADVKEQIDAGKVRPGQVAEAIEKTAQRHRNIAKGLGVAEAKFDGVGEPDEGASDDSQATEEEQKAQRRLKAGSVLVPVPKSDSE